MRDSTLTSWRGLPALVLPIVLFAACAEPPSGPPGVPVAIGSGSIAMTYADLDGDGLDDMVFAGQASTATRQTEAQVIYGRRDASPQLTADAFFETGSAGGRFIHFLADRGDFNGDGFDDVLLLARTSPQQDLVEAEPPFVHVIYGAAERLAGGASLVDATHSIAIDEPGANSWAIQTEVLGDIDSDGFDEFAVHFFLESGTSWYFAGSAETPQELVPSWVAGPDEPRWRGVGDVDGDGHDDLLEHVGPWDWRVHYGPQGFERSGPGERLFRAGRACFFQSGGLDLDGDARGDFVFRCDQNGAFPRLRIVFSDGRGTLGTPAPGRVTDIACGDDCGIVSAGDVNGDGVSDLLLGDDQRGCSGPIGPCAGRIDRYLSQEGRPALSAPSDRWNGATEPYNEGLGFFVAQDGDFNGDGYADAALGALARPARLVFGAP